MIVWDSSQKVDVSCASLLQCNLPVTFLNRLSKMRSGTMGAETSSPSETGFSDANHLFNERFIFDDDPSATTTTSSSSRLPSIPRSIWKDEQGLGGVGSAAIGGSSYLPRYLQMGADDDDSFPTMVGFERVRESELPSSIRQHPSSNLLLHLF